MPLMCRQNIHLTLVTTCVHRLIGYRADEAGLGELLSSADATPHAPVDAKPHGSWGPSEADVQAIARTHAGEIRPQPDPTTSHSDPL